MWGGGGGGGESVNAYLMKNSKRQTQTDRQRQTDGQRLFSCFTKTRSLWCGDYSSALLNVVRGLIVSDHLHFAHICFFFLVVLVVTEQPLSLSPCSGNALVHLLWPSIYYTRHTGPPQRRPVKPDLFSFVFEVSRLFDVLPPC